MEQRDHEDHPIHRFFEEEVREALLKTGLAGEDDVQHYLVVLLSDFMHRDSIYAIRDASGRRIESVVGMLAEGDLLLNADSFDRERQVHKHIGDFMLFWSGIFPEFVQSLEAPDSVLDCVRQGQVSYAIASSFEHDPYGIEAPTLRKLSDRFLGYQQSLSLVRASFEGFRRQGWSDGFRA